MGSTDQLVFVPVGVFARFPFLAAEHPQEKGCPCTESCALSEMPMTFNEMYGQFAPPVYRFALSLCGEASLADDITSETFYRAWTAKGEIRDATLQSYLFTIAQNLFRDHQRKARRNIVIEPDIDEKQPQLSRNLEKEVTSSVELQRVMKSLSDLPELDRASLLLRAQDGLSYEEIAEKLKQTPGSIRVRVHRARLKLLLAGTESKAAK